MAKAASGKQKTEKTQQWHLTSWFIVSRSLPIVVYLDVNRLGSDTAFRMHTEMSYGCMYTMV